MTDNNIIKGFLCCLGMPKCNECPYSTSFGNCKETMIDECIDFFCRQLKDQCSNCSVLKAKSETVSDLNEQIGYWQRGYNDLRQEMKTAKAEAVKEFAEMLKKKIICRHYNLTKYNDFIAALNAIDNLVKELTEGNNDG